MSSGRDAGREREQERSAGSLPGGRLRRVLFGVVREYADTALPVASRSVARRVGVSAATIRSDMAELAELGLLSQPHTSAGRVPTESAFRLYVDFLISRTPRAKPGPEDAELAATAGLGDELMRRAAHLVSHSTGQLGFFVAGRSERLVLRHVHAARLSTERVMVLLVSDRGVVQTRAVEESGIDQRTLDRLAVRLSEFVGGCTLAEARARLEREVRADRERSDALWRKALALGAVGLADAPGELYLGDVHCLLGHPEFSDVDRLREVFAALEEKEVLMRLLDKVLSADAVSVLIGHELDEPAMDDCALVAAPLGEGAAPGGLGVIGPVRMRYDRVIPAVRSLSALVGRYLS
jgi:heat-inducible transcriptional repressor